MIDSMVAIIPNTGILATRIWKSQVGRLLAMPSSDAEDQSKPSVDPAKLLLADNLTRLMADSRDLKTIKQLSAASGVSTGTIDRLRKAEVAAGIDNLRLLADAFGLQAWQMLVPNLDTTNHPLLEAESLRLKQLYTTLKHSAEAIEGHLRGEGNTGSGNLDENPENRKFPGSGLTGARMLPSPHARKSATPKQAPSKRGGKK